MQQSIRPFSRKNLPKTLIISAAAVMTVLLFGNALAGALRLFFGACVIAFLLTPAVRLLEKKTKPPIAVLLTLSAAVAGILLLIVLVLPLLIRQFSVLPEMLPDAFARLKEAEAKIGGWIEARFPEFELPKFDLGAVENSFSEIARRAADYAGGIADRLYAFALTAALSYFLMVGRDRALLRTELLIPLAWRRTAVRMGNAILRELRLYLRGQAAIALTVGIVAGISLMLLGVPGGIALGAVVGLFNVVPYLGPIIGGIPAVIMALSIGWQRALMTVGALLIVQQIDGLVISPRIMGGITGFSPSVILVALYIASRIGGIWSMVLVLPLMMSFRTAYRVFVQKYENY